MAAFSTPYLFPFCIPEEDPTGNANYPIGLLLADFIEWDKRVKNWKLDSSLTASASNGSTLSIVALAPPQTSATSITSETDLVCRANHEFDITAQDTQSDSGGTDFLYADVYTSVIIRTDLAVKHEGLYYPYIEAYVSAIASSDGDGYSSISSIDGYLGQTDATDATVLFIDGQFIVFPYKNDSDGSTLTGCSLSAIEVTPAEYWPYDPGDGGGPIWNSTTGTQERDPFGWQP